MRAALLSIAAVAFVTIGFAQTTPPPSPAPGSASVRVPAWRQLRTAVGSLLGWQVGVSVGSFRQETFVEAARKAEALDLAVIEGDGMQKVSLQIPKNLDYRLAPGELSAVRERMTTLNLRMPAYFVPEMGNGEQTARKIFEFAKNLGVETLVVERTPDTVIDSLADEFGINVALSGSPKTVLEALRGRSQRLGAYADLGKWMQDGTAPLDGVLLLKERMLAIRLSDRSALGKGGHAVPLGSGVAGIAQLLAELHKRGLKPSFIAVDVTGGPDVSADLKRSLEGFEKAVQPVVAERVMQLSRR
jgi:sugar phosphate isomerase/epimerase